MSARPGGRPRRERGPCGVEAFGAGPFGAAGLAGGVGGGGGGGGGRGEGEGWVVYGASGPREAVAPGKFRVGGISVGPRLVCVRRCICASWNLR